MENTADEIKRLQSCINNLISVLALPAIWSGSESSQIIGTLLDALLAMLRLDFACARLNDSIDGSPIEVVRLAQRQHPSAQPQQVGQALGRWLSGDQAASRFVIPNPVGEGEVAIASFSLGLQDEVGVLVAGSRRADFPTDIELLLLRVAANQAAIGLQEARRSGDQKRVAEALERRVAERTSQLTAVNEELRRSQAYLAEAQRLSHTGSFGWRVSIGEIIWSEETFRIFQYDRTTIPTVELVLQRVHPEDAALVKQTIERASQDGKDFDHEYRLVMPDGSIKYVHVVAHALSDESGSIEFVGAVMDVTAAKQAEETLRESEAYLAEAQRLSHTGSWALNVATREIVHWSQEHYRLFGFDPEKDKPSFETFHQRAHPQDRARCIEMFERAVRERADFELDFRSVLPDGVMKYIHSVAHPVFDDSGDLVKYIGTIMDVTERTRAEQQLAGRLRQQAIVAELGQYALATPDSQAIMEKAVILLADALDVEYTKVLELLPDGKALRLRAGVGWKEGVVGSATVGTDTNSQAGYTLLSAEPVIVEDLRSEARFTGPSLLRDHSVVSGMSVIIGGGEQPWGVLGAHTSRRRDFTNDDIQFLQAVANIIADAIQRERAEVLLAGEKRLLEMIARGDSRALILEGLCRLVEELASGSLSSILLLDPNANCLRYGAAPSLPITYIEAIDGAVIGPSVGSCGTAAYRAEPVIVSDIATDPLWADYRNLALAHGLRACWSTPILSSAGRVLGTFATYYREPRSPSPQEHNVIERITHLASIAVEREQAEEKLRRSEAYLAEAQRLSHTGSWAWTPATGDIRYWSEECYRVLGFDPYGGQPRFETFFQRIHPDDQPRTAEKFEKAKRERAEFELNYRIVHPGGEIRDIHVVDHPVLSPSGDLVEFVGTVIDVTERKRAEEKIRQSEREFRQLLNLTPQHVTVLGPDGSRLYSNQAALDYHGLTLEEWQHADPDRLFHPEDWERMTREVQSKFLSGSSYEIEARLRRRDGQYRWFLFRYNPTLDEQGHPTRWYAAATDIEDRKQVEQRLKNENVALREEIDKAWMFEEIVGTSPPLQTVLSRISKVAPSDSSVLITGETGTGKELVARAIHRRSRRSSRAFVSVNCAAIPGDLIASELFGHEKGAFTGATQRRLGRFELAEGGTIFLDEVGELPAETQIALLRVLQEHEFERVGGTRSIQTNVRVIAATNRDLQAAIAAGTVRSDLFYRLNVFPIEVPPLRERREDIPVLVEYFIDRYARKAGKSICGVNKKSLELLQSYPWPGNIRELQNVIERSVIVCDTENFSVDESWLSRQPLASEPKSQLELSRKLAAQEKEMIEAALGESGGRVSGPSGAAAKLGIPGSTLESKIRSLKINKNRFKTTDPSTDRI